MIHDLAIDLKQVVKTYGGLAGGVKALRGVDLEVRRGEFLSIMGKSGAGKTTLVNVIAGLDRSTSGEIWVDGTPVHRLGVERVARWRGCRVGVVFQTFELLPTLTVLQNVTLPMDFAGRYTLRQRRRRAMDLLKQVDIAEHAHKVPSGLSGGQQQRAAIARALANDPPLLLADEPTGSLDSATASAVVQVFERLADEGKTVVLVTHDKDMARRAARTITLADGKIVRQTSSVHLCPSV
jgi:putative ABC transport system ATP-binding protein